MTMTEETTPPYYDALDECRFCHGTGIDIVAGLWQLCPVCRGTGERDLTQQDINRDDRDQDQP
jgi:DnaJ-class molecular chaperone